MAHCSPNGSQVRVKASTSVMRIVHLMFEFTQSVEALRLPPSLGLRKYAFLPSREETHFHLNSGVCSKNLFYHKLTSVSFFTEIFIHKKPTSETWVLSKKIEPMLPQAEPSPEEPST
jgi:hypothetical protein